MNRIQAEVVAVRTALAQGTVSDEINKIYAEVIAVRTALAQASVANEAKIIALERHRGLGPIRRMRGSPSHTIRSRQKQRH